MTFENKKERYLKIIKLRIKNYKCAFTNCIKNKISQLYNLLINYKLRKPTASKLHALRKPLKCLGQYYIIILNRKTTIGHCVRKTILNDV